MYNKKVQLKHNEKLAIVDVETGEIKEVPNGSGNPRSQYHNADKTFSKRYVLAWRLLATQTTATEFNAANILSDKARAFTNSLIPLNDETTLVKLSEELKINRNIVGKIIEKLFSLGVIARFQVSNYDEGTQEFELAKYWVFNPYLSSSDSFILTKEIHLLFKDTDYYSLFNQEKLINNEKAGDVNDNIYVLAQQIPEGIIYKLGYSSNIDKRLETYYSHNPSIKLVKTFYLNNGKEFEKQFHKENKSDYKNEWYFTNPLDLITFF